VSEPHKCDCQKLVIALLDRADALHREERMMLEYGNSATYSKLMKLQAENERLRKAGDAMEIAYCELLRDKLWCRSPMLLSQVKDPVTEAWLAAKGVQP